MSEVTQTVTDVSCPWCCHSYYFGWNRRKPTWFQCPNCRRFMPTEFAERLGTRLVLLRPGKAEWRRRW